MNLAESPSPIDNRGTAGQRLRAYAVHVYTASGVALAFLAALEMTVAQPDPRYIFLLLFGTVFIDATDGPLARRWDVKRWAARIDGRTIDDIVDYLTFTFLPLVLMARMQWLPEPVWLWIVPALIASLFGFANREAKDESDGFFLGFPSYWNVVAFYAGFAQGPAGVWFNAALVVGLAALTIAPVRFLYPNVAPRPWKALLLLGAFAWVAILVAMLIDYPNAPGWLIVVSLVYPAFYTVLSFALDSRRRAAL
jgi:phosphatidylcholine synthase